MTVFYLSDALGNLLATFNNTQGAAAIQGNQVYGPYGNSLYSSGSMDTAKGYTGQYADSLTGLDYYVSRYYDPVVGIFLSPDEKEGNAAGMNPYAYVDGNPETDTDPTGQMYAPGTGGGNSGNGNPSPPPNHGPVPCVGQDCGSNPPHQPKPLNPQQLAQWCVQNVQCVYAVQRYDDAQQSAIEQNILLFGMAFFEFEDDPDAFAQAAEAEVNDWEVLAQTMGIKLDNAVVEALNSSDTAKQVEGQAGAIAQIYSELTGFDVKYGPNAIYGQNDVETPVANIEAKSGSMTNALPRLKKQFNNPITNPDGKPFVVYAPGWDEEDAMEVYRYLGSLDSGRDLYIATSSTQLIEIMEYFVQEGPPSF